MKPAPIALFTYNRLEHTRQTVEALEQNQLASLSDLYVFSDGPKSEDDEAEVDAVRRYLETVRGFYSLHVTKQDLNMGLAQSVIRGVSQVSLEQGRVIVLRDGLLVTSPHFLRYMNDALNLYEDVPDVVSINGYIYPSHRLSRIRFCSKARIVGAGRLGDAGGMCLIPTGMLFSRNPENNDLTTEFDFNGAYPYTQMLPGPNRGTK